jgi:hypothetical protein
MGFPHRFPRFPEGNPINFPYIFPIFLYEIHHVHPRSSPIPHYFTMGISTTPQRRNAEQRTAATAAHVPAQLLHFLAFALQALFCLMQLRL